MLCCASNSDRFIFRCMRDAHRLGFSAFYTFSPSEETKRESKMRRRKKGKKIKDPLKESRRNRMFFIHHARYIGNRIIKIPCLGQDKGLQTEPPNLKISTGTSVN